LNAAAMRIYLFVIMGILTTSKSGYLSPLFLLAKIENSTTEKPPHHIQQSRNCSQKKCGVKLHRHSNHSAGRTENSKKRARPVKPPRAGRIGYVTVCKKGADYKMIFEMRNNFKTLFIALAAAIVLGSCKDDEPTAISVNEVAGDYAAVAVFYLLNADGTISTGETGTFDNMPDIEFDLIKISVSGNKVTAKDSDDKLVFESVDLVEAANGVVWNLAIPQDFFSGMEESGYTVAGFEKYEMEGKKYQAFYDAKEKTIDFSLALISSIEENPDVVIEFVCTK
jgi:hypothetical protein